MLELAIEDIISKIAHGETFTASPPDSSFTIKIDEYIPYVCASLHSGHKMREELIPLLNLEEHERWYEEDPETDKLIESFPIQIIARDSRFEYDLNRSPEEAVYTSAWGKNVWRQPVPADEKRVSIRKHANFYRVCHALIEKIEQLFGGCLIYDIHSFNHRKKGDFLPVFNIGTEHIDISRYTDIIHTWKRELQKITIPNLTTEVQENMVFNGRGYFLRYITGQLQNTLVLATEIRKIYCNEETGELYPLVITSISNGLKKAVLHTSARFSRFFTNMKTVKKGTLLSHYVDTDIRAVDKGLFDIVKDFEILSYINPLNLESEKKAFFRSRYSVNPRFRYRQLIINPFEFKRKLFNLPVEKIKDINVEMLYKDVIASYADKIDLISSIGSDKFLYNSLRYFGEPSEIDLQNARFLLNCPTLETTGNDEDITSEHAKEHFGQAAKGYGFTCRVEVSKNIVSKVLVLNTRKTIKLRKNSLYSENSLNALINHEIGVHMLTTVNARLQPLKLMRVGMPVNTKTQEGMAILSEYLSGTLTIERMKELALRVMAVHKMVNGHDFCETFSYLKNISRLSDERVFYLTARAFRGGGFTKDYLYLRGFREVLKYFGAGNRLEWLLVGKTSVHYAELIHELIDRKILLPPRYVTKAFVSPVTQDPVFPYIMSAIKDEKVCA